MSSHIPSSHRPSPWRRALAGAAALAVLALPALLFAAGPQPLPLSQQVAKVTGPQVHIDNFQFTPAALTVPAGTTVTWTNQDDMVHTVTSADQVFSSPSLETDEAFTYTFTKPGIYTYFCKLHPRMTATVIVQ
ncbi:MAG TPA: cupredoxin family copper-binding protein [Candidatus Methylomirabilis sp.]|nr:cupredoxin family copper-binding protein [Candidatus Methylomirabilis sp.]